MKTENMKINFLTQISPQQQMQAVNEEEQPTLDAPEAAELQVQADAQQETNALAEKERKEKLNRNERALASTVTDLTVTFYDYIDNAGGFFGFLAGGKKKAAKDNIDGFVPIITADLNNTLQALYADGKNPEPTKIQATIGAKLEKLKTAEGFQNYMVELANQKKADGSNVLTDKQLESIFGKDYRQKMADGFSATELSDKFKEDIGKLYSDSPTATSVGKIVDKGKELLLGDEATIKAYQEEVARKAVAAKKEGGFDFMGLLEKLAETFPGLKAILDLIKQFTGGEAQQQTAAARTGQQTQGQGAVPPASPEQFQGVPYRQPDNFVPPPGFNPAEFTLGLNWQESDVTIPFAPGYATGANNGIATGNAK